MLSTTPIEMTVARAMRFRAAKRKGEELRNREYFLTGVKWLRKLDRAAYSIQHSPSDSLPKSSEQSERELQEAADEMREQFMAERLWTNDLVEKFLSAAQARVEQVTGKKVKHVGDSIASIGTHHRDGEVTRDMTWSPVFVANDSVFSVAVRAGSDADIALNIPTSRVSWSVTSVVTGKPVEIPLEIETAQEEFQIGIDDPRFLTDPRFVMHSIRMWERFSQRDEHARDFSYSAFDRFIYRANGA